MVKKMKGVEVLRHVDLSTLIASRGADAAGVIPGLERALAAGPWLRIGPTVIRADKTDADKYVLSDGTYTVTVDGIDGVFCVLDSMERSFDPAEQFMEIATEFVDNGRPYTNAYRVFREKRL
jgi:hypothetical protein